MRSIEDFEFIPLNGWNVYGGPFRSAPHDRGYRTLCLQAEPRQVGAPQPDQYLRIQDFSVPDIRNAVFMLAWVMFESIVRRRPVYIGCFGGTGRTGLMLAILIRVAYGDTGERALVRVRKQYRSRAVETEEQEKYLASFPVKNLVLWLKICKLIAMIR